MNTNYQLRDLQIRVDALELLLVAGDEITKENLQVYRDKAEGNHAKKREEFRKEQWGKIMLGSLIEYEIYPTGPSLVLEIISISPQPFRYLAGKILRKAGKSGYSVGDVFTVTSPSKVTLRTTMSCPEVISRD